MILIICIYDFIILINYIAFVECILKTKELQRYQTMFNNLTVSNNTGMTTLKSYTSIVRIKQRNNYINFIRNQDMQHTVKELK